MFGCQLGDTVGGERLGEGLLPEGKVLRLAVHGGGRGKHQAPEAGRASHRLQEALRCQDIGLHVDTEFRAPAGPDAGLPGLMEDEVRFCDDRAQIRLSHVELNKAESGIAQQCAQVRHLDGPGIVVGEGIDTDDPVPLAEQSLGEVRPDEPGDPCHQRG